jgi:hypothetical protein
MVGPRAVPDAVVTRKVPSPCRESNPRTPIIQPVAQRDKLISATIIMNGISTGKECNNRSTNMCTWYMGIRTTSHYTYTLIIENGEFKLIYIRSMYYLCSRVHRQLYTWLLILNQFLYSTVETGPAAVILPGALPLSFLWYPQHLASREKLQPDSFIGRAAFNMLSKYTGSVWKVRELVALRSCYAVMPPSA